MSVSLYQDQFIYIASLAIDLQIIVSPFTLTASDLVKFRLGFYLLAQSFNRAFQYLHIDLGGWNRQLAIAEDAVDFALNVDANLLMVRRVFYPRQQFKFQQRIVVA